ncbi:hypothetical protein KBX43_04935 [Micromonospora sp. C41]|nr:hypothetical protein [Micromonospora sp. C41]MBQ1060072.1 hypothetical protein [Micromonospora sp. C41]
MTAGSAGIAEPTVDVELRPDYRLALAWTIADLDGRDRPGRDDVAEAIQLRTGEAP